MTEATHSRGWMAPALLFAAAWHAPALAQTQGSLGVPAQGHGTASIVVYHAKAHRRVLPDAFGGGLVEQGDVTQRSVTLALDYGLTDRLALDVTLPFKSNRYDGSTPHDPSRLVDDHGERLIDDGHYHGGWGDWGVGLRYLWRAEPVAITPFVSLYVPSSEYPIFTAAARGTRQRRLDVGVNVGGRFPGALRNLTWQAGYAYSYMEKTRPDNSPDHRVNHSIVSVQLGYAASPQWSYSLGWRYRKTHGALSMPQDFNFPLTDDLFYHHDQLFGLEQGIVEAGTAYQWNDRYTLFASYGRTNHVAFGQEIERALGFGISRSF
jgi:hypothetical protein